MSRRGTILAGLGQDFLNFGLSDIVVVDVRLISGRIDVIANFHPGIIYRLVERRLTAPLSAGPGPALGYRTARPVTGPDPGTPTGC